MDSEHREDAVKTGARQGPIITAVEMGYGHMRAAQALADAAGSVVVPADREPYSTSAETASWRRSRSAYEALTRGVEWPLVGPAFRRALESVTEIPSLESAADLRAPNAAANMLARMAKRGFGAALVDEVRRSGRPLVSTFYAQAIVAAGAGLPDVTLVVTDVDVNRVWAPVDAARTRLRYCVPAPVTARRLERYGVPAEWIEVTGFPLPPALTGGTDLAVARSHLRNRLARLDPRGAFLADSRREVESVVGEIPAATGVPPLLTVAVGGAGAQTASARQFVASLAPEVLAGRLRLALVAGVRPEVAAMFRDAVASAGLASLGPESLRIVAAPDLVTYFRAVESLLAETDVLWTKPSEMTFFAALGIPLLLAPPLGVHETRNRAYARQRGAALRAPSGPGAAAQVAAWTLDGTLARAAWRGFTRLPRRGTHRILAGSSS